VRKIFKTAALLLAEKSLYCYVRKGAG
jgi:hypothetical protein